MALATSRITLVGDTPYAHEREAIDLAIAELPNSDPYLLWALLELLDPSTGRLHEIDLLILGYSVLYLVEVKSGPGLYEGDSVDWRRTPDGEPARYMDPPLRLTNLKAKILKSRLRAHLRDPGHTPWIEPLVLLSHPKTRLALTPDGMTGVVTRKTFRRAITKHEFPGASPRADGRTRQRISRPAMRDIAQALGAMGIRPRQGKILVGSYQLGQLVDEGPGYQDRLALHRDNPQHFRRRARTYLVPAQTSVEHRQRLRRAADREAQLLHDVREHEHVLRCTDYITDAPLGPTVLFDSFDGGVALDAFLRQHPDLDLAARVELVKQVGRALAYCHKKGITHGGLCPHAVLARRHPDTGALETRLHDFQLAAGTGVEATSHLSLLASDDRLMYQAPEVWEGAHNRGPQADVFSLGALAFTVFTGRPPGVDEVEVSQHLARFHCLDPSAADDTIPEAIADAIRQATKLSFAERVDDVSAWIEWLDFVARPPETEPVEPDDIHPMEARRDDFLDGDLLVAGVLGHGATARVLHVVRDADGRDLALKISASPDHDQRLQAEARVLGELRHSRIVQFHELRIIRDRPCLLLSLAGLKKHPWSLAGGGATELKKLLEERADKSLDDVASSIGITSFTLEDDVYLRPFDSWRRCNIESERLRPMVIGEVIRDWAISETLTAFFPYTDKFKPIESDADELRSLWSHRTNLSNNKLFGGKTKIQGGLQWYEFGRLTADKLRTPLSIAFAFVATHNHFALDRGGKVFNRTAPIIKLPADASEDDHLALLAYLNSSTACFWMKQVFFDKGNRGEGGGLTAEQWEKFYEFDGTKLKGAPLPSLSPVVRSESVMMARTMDDLAEQRRKLLAVDDLFESASSVEELAGQLDERRAETVLLESRIRALQERLDWWFYAQQGFCNPSLIPSDEQLDAGARASDVVFARAVCDGAPGRRYFKLCRLPDPEMIASDAWVKRWELSGRAKAITDDKTLATLEHPKYKRTFREGWRPLDTRSAAESWLAQIVEQTLQEQVQVMSATAIFHAIPERVNPVSELCMERIWDAEGTRKLLDKQAVPFLAAYRYTTTGLAKHETWQQTWDLQRREDAGETIDGGIPVPPKYASKDYRAPVYWRLRGKLDVPKERFIAYPGCESDHDQQPVYGWAGWTHLQRAQALAAMYQARKLEEAWPAERLTPILTGLLELIPWVKQWHNAPDPDFDGLQMGDYFENFLHGQLRELALTQDDLRAWRPPKKQRGKRGKRRRKS